jgi:hypothetical protein
MKQIIMLKNYLIRNSGDCHGFSPDASGQVTSVSPNTPFSNSAGLAQARGELGAKFVTGLQNAILTSNVKGFWATTAQDARAHPYKYGLKAGEVIFAVAPIPWLQEVEGFKLSVELHVGVVELLHAMNER